MHFLKCIAMGSKGSGVMLKKDSIRIMESKANYLFYLKEMEFRFNYRNEGIFNLLFDICGGV